MKNKFFIIVLAFIGVYLASCEPVTMEKPDIGTPPSESQMSFTITPGDDDFHVVITNTSSVTGIANWDLGNGSKATGNEVVASYSLADTYTITLTLITKGGTGTSSQDYEQIETDYSIFTDPLYIALSGGVDAVDGKTWVLDSLNEGHLGIGGAYTNVPDWWHGNPLEKSGHYLYDDEFTFKIAGFFYDCNTHGATHVNFDWGAFDAGIAAGYYTGVVGLDGDTYDRDASTDDAARGSLTWSVIEEDGKSFIQMSAPGGVLGYDGGLDRKYEILEWSENFLYVRSTKDGGARYNKLIPKGYVKPTISYDLNVTASASANEYNVSLTNVSIPSGLTIDNITFDFGNESSTETTETTAVHTVTYMRAGTYTITSTIISGTETFVNTQTIVVANNHPSYVEYLLDAMVMYNDFGETTAMTVGAENCTVEVVANPDKSIWPNRSNNCAKYTKVNQEWANANMQLPTGYRFDLRSQSTFKILVYGTAGQTVLLKLENTDRGGNAWQTGTELTYTIQETNKWEIAEYSFAGVGAGWDWTGDIYTGDVTTDPNFNQGFYNIIRIMYQPGDNSQEYSFYFDDLAGPHIEGLK